LIRKYQLYLRNKSVFTRASSLPSEYTEWCLQNIPDIFKHYSLSTMNDLGSLLQYTRLCDAPGKSEIVAISKAEEFGLIKGKKLNLG